MTVSILPPAYTTFFDDDGVPVALGYLYTYVPSTTTPKTTWQNSGGTITNTNPVRLDAAGRCLCWGEGYYRTILQDVDGNEIWDSVTGFAEIETYTISPTDYGGDPTGVVDSTSAINQASAAAVSQGKPLILNGRYLCSGAVTVAAPITILAGAAFIQNSTLALNGAVLAAPGDHIFQGFGTVTFGAGAVPEVYPEWWGAAADGSTDDFDAIQAAVTAAAGGQVRFGAAYYAISDEVVLVPNTTILGSGSGSTTIIPTTLEQTAFSLEDTDPVEAYVTIADLAIAPTTTLVTGVKFTFCSFTTIRGVDFLGCNITVAIDRGGFHTVEDCRSISTAISHAGTLIMYSSTDTQTHVAGDQYCYWPIVKNYAISTATDFGITTRANDPACYFRRCVSGVFDSIKGSFLSAGSPGVGFIVLENDCQGCKFINCTASAASFGIILQPGTGLAASPSYTEITNCDCDFFWSAGIWLNGTVAAPVAFTHITGGFQTAPQVSGAFGILATYANYTTVVGVQVHNYNTTLGTGFKLENCNLATITDSQVTAMTVGIVYGTGNTNIFIRDNWFNLNSTELTGTVAGTSSRITNNTGLNPPAIATPAVPSTGVPYTNTQGYDLRISVSGTVSAIAVNGIATGLTSGVFQVNCGENITITHGAGAWAWMPL